MRFAYNVHCRSLGRTVSLRVEGNPPPPSLLNVAGPAPAGDARPDVGDERPRGRGQGPVPRIDEVEVAVQRLLEGYGPQISEIIGCAKHARHGRQPETSPHQSLGELRVVCAVRELDLLTGTPK